MKTQIKNVRRKPNNATYHQCHLVNQEVIMQLLRGHQISISSRMQEHNVGLQQNV
jgi:hypothetical protein